MQKLINLLKRFVREEQRIHDASLDGRAYETLGATVGIDDPDFSDPEILKRRIVTNAPARRALKVNFPDVFNRIGHPKWFKLAAASMNEQLDNAGLDGIEGRTIYIAYPRKNPHIFPHHSDFDPRDMFRRLKKKFPKTNWVLVDNIVENRHLDRSSNQTSLHALTQKQDYEVLGPASQNPFLNQQAPPLFLIFDNNVEQGTTMANFASFIEHNGGKILGIVATESRFRQKDTRQRFRHVTLSGPFTDTTRNIGRLAEMADAFYKSVKDRDLMTGFPAKADHQGMLENFEDVLNQVGHSVFAMTDGEARRLIQTLRHEFYDSGMEDYFEMMKTLRDIAGQQAQEQDAAAADNAKTPVTRIPSQISLHHGG